MRTTRRGALALAAAAGAWGLAACSAATRGATAAGGSGSAAPSTATNKIKLSFEPLNAGLWSGQGSKLVADALWQTLEPWRQANPSVDLTMLPFGGDTDTTEILTGTAPDVILAWQDFGALSGQDLLLNLTPYLRAANRTLSVWPSYAIDAYQVGGNTYALPFYVATTSMVVNEAVLDGLGLSYPAEDATFADWTRLWSSATVKGTKPRYGGTIKQTECGLPQAYFQGWGGSIMDSADPTRCTIDAPAAVATGNAIFPLIVEGICAWDYGNDVGGLLTAGTYATACMWNAALAITTLDVQLARLPKWNFYPMPVLPQGAFASTQYDFRAISATTPQPAAAYSLLDWLSFEPDFQRALMRLGLEPPALTSLQEEYTTVLATIVPPFKSKNLSVLTQYIQNNGAIMDPIFPYDEPQAQALLLSSEQKIATGAVGVTVGLQQLAQQVSAMEAAGKATTANQQSAQSRFPVRGADIATLGTGI
jgi:ABC-type glycerol-3-phosphate transport system substrate-binding protein